MGLRAYDKCKCRNCLGWFCERHIYSYVDGNNIAITKNSPLYCLECYREKYPNTKPNTQKKGWL